MNRLEKMGWNASFVEALAMRAREGCVPARVIGEQRDRLEVRSQDGSSWARLSGRFRHEAHGHEDRAAVGDWVLLEPATAAEGVVHGVLPRVSAIVRRAAKTAVVAQVVAANVDTAFLVMSLNRDFNPRRAERYLAMIGESGAQAVVVLNKIDLCDDLAAAQAEIAPIVGESPVHPISAQDGGGVEALRPYCTPGRTVAVMGSSGVGKSTLINRLLGVEVQLVREIRTSDDRGRHTTTGRHLIEMPTGGMLIDTPGMRELGLFDASDGLQTAFPDIESLMGDCRFGDCRHAQEPGCAVRAALDAGTLDAARYDSYCRLQREIAFVASKQDNKAAVERRQSFRRQSKTWRKHFKADPRIRAKRGHS